MNHCSQKVFDVGPTRTGLLVGLTLFVWSVILGIMAQMATAGRFSFLIPTAVGASLFALIASSEYLDRPKYAEVKPIEFTLVYRLRKPRSYNWQEVAWLDLWPGGGGCSPYASVKLENGRLHPIALSYEAGKEISRAYEEAMGKKPPNQNQYLKVRGGVRWFSGGPSE